MMNDLEQIKRAISKLRIVDLNASSAIDSINLIIKNDLKNFAFPSFIFEAGLNLFRCRNNDSDEDFEFVEQLSNRMDLDNVTEYGRANIPKQSIFYCSDTISTSISESGSAFRCDKYMDIDKFSITTGQWESIDNLEIVLILNNKIAQEKNELIRKYKIDIDKFTKEIFNDESEKVQTIMNFVADEFSINTKCNHKLYKICSSFAQYFYQAGDGFLYPSIQRNFEGFNFAIKPDSVSKIKLVRAKRDTFIKTGEKKYDHTETKDTIRIEDDSLIWGNIEQIASR